MNFKCPFCYNELISESRARHILNLVCPNLECQELSPQKCVRWTIDIDSEGNIIWYAARLKVKEINYVIIAESYRPEPSTKLYYDAPDYGALLRIPMIEIACFLEPKEPLHDCLIGYVEKLISYIVFT